MEPKATRPEQGDFVRGIGVALYGVIYSVRGDGTACVGFVYQGKYGMVYDLRAVPIDDLEKITPGELRAFSMR